MSKCVNRKFKGWRKYPGSASEICSQIIADCWNGRFFQTSAGHFCEFYSRDIGWSTDALIALGFKAELTKTVEYAFSKFNNIITVAISPRGKPFNFPNIPSIDSIGYFLRTLDSLKNKQLIENHRYFIQKNMDFAQSMMQDGLLNNVHVSSMKDYSIRNSSMYDNCFLEVINKFAKKNKFDFRFDKKRLMDFWNGEFFYEDLKKQEHFVSDANIVPIWLGIINKKTMINKILREIEELKLNRPFLLAYTHEHSKEIPINFLVNDWERNSLWFSLGMMYLDVLKREKSRKYKPALNAVIGCVKRFGNVIEVYSPEGNPYKSLFYHADEGMLCASMLLDHLK